MTKRSQNILWGALFFALFLSACSAVEETTPAAPPATMTPAPVLTGSPTPQPQRELTICLAQEPNTLYPYGDPNRAAKSVLAAIYDGPYDSLSYAYQPVILQKMPAYQDGDVSFESVLVSPGDEVVDVDGNLTALEAGVRVFQAGCQAGADCVIAYDGSEPFMLDEMVVAFSLLPDLRWADGNPITADDSVFAYDLAVASELDSMQYLLARTSAYEAVDPLTVVWRGKPGYRDNRYMTNFFAPMPYHVWSVFSARDLLETDVSSRFPLGWGAYVVDEWLPGESIRLVKNPIYFRAGEGLPKMDALTFVFMDNSDAALAALVNGECDLLDPAIALNTQLALLEEMQSREELRLYTAPSTSLEQLVFGIRPSGYDDGIVSGNERPDFFGNPKMRQAIAACLDREQALTSVLRGYGVVPATYLSPAHPLYASGLPIYSYDPEAGAAALSALGWKDEDNDPTTPRIAYQVENVADGVRLVLRYMTTTAIQRRQTSEILANSLRACGIGVEMSYLPLDEFYALGPQGALFGRDFDLAQLAMGADNFQPPCEWYTSAQTPNSDNDWLAANLSGYSNAAFDAACERARLAPREADAYLATQIIFAEDLPSVPLYAHLNIAAARPDLCGFSLDPTAESALWNVEEFDIGKCSP